MAVNIRGTTFYSEAEVSAMTPSGTMDSQWETYDLPVPTGVTLNWQANKFHVNKITGLVVGWIGLNTMQNMPTTLIVGTNSNLAIHSGMRLKYSGQYEYGSVKATAPENIRATWKECNGIWDTNGTLKLEGKPVGASTTYTQNFDSFIEHYAHIGSKYGKITTTDMKQPTYLAEGAFYDSNTADLITGRAWLRIDGTLDATVYDTTRSFITWYKNLWSGEIIVQYSLYSKSATYSNTIYSITMPDRCKVVEGRNCYTDIRYLDTSTQITAAQRQTCWMRLYNNQIQFYPNNSISTWFTGTQYYPGESEVRTQNASYEIQSLWFPEANVSIPSAVNNKWPSATNANTKQTASGVNAWMNTSIYKGRDGIPNWVWRSKRTGMIFCHFDMSLVGDTISTGDIFAANTNWSSDWIPSYRYNRKSGTAQPIYFSGAGYLDARASTTAEASNLEYSCNINFYSGKSLGVQDTSITNYGGLKWGTSGNWKPVANNLACFVGYYLGNSNGTIVK